MTPRTYISENTRNKWTPLKRLVKNVEHFFPSKVRTHGTIFQVIKDPSEAGLHLKYL